MEEKKLRLYLSFFPGFFFFFFEQKALHFHFAEGSKIYAAILALVCGNLGQCAKASVGLVGYRVVRNKEKGILYAVCKWILIVSKFQWEKWFSIRKKGQEKSHQDDKRPAHALTRWATRGVTLWEKWHPASCGEPSEGIPHISATQLRDSP